MEALDLAAGLGVVGSRVLAFDAKTFEFGLEHDFAATGVGGEDRAVVGEQGLGQAVAGACGQEAAQHVGGFEPGPGIRADQESGMIVEKIEDLHLGAVGQPPEGDVGLPKLVGQIGLESDEGGLGPLVGLGGDQAMTGEDAPDGGH